jgi:uncharacterized protein with HEPN domain
MLSLSLVRLLEIIGEAARGISQEFRDAYPDIAWKNMVGMRDRLIHGYFDVDLDVVWETVIEDLPPLITHLEKIIDTVENVDKRRQRKTKEDKGK